MKPAMCYLITASCPIGNRCWRVPGWMLGRVRQILSGMNMNNPEQLEAALAELKPFEINDDDASQA